MRTLILLFGLAVTVGALAVQPEAGRMVLAQNEVRGMAFDIFIRLQKGMSEGELILRAGKPDSESVENMRFNIVKSYYYLPTASDPWITTIRLEGGRITDLERIKKF